MPDGGATATIQVTPEDFHTVATQIGHGVAQLGQTARTLHAMTSAAAGIAGVDDGAKQFDAGCQQALNTLFQAFDRAGEVLTDVAVGIDLSGAHHWDADAAATPGGGSPLPWPLLSGLYFPQNLQASLG